MTKCEWLEARYLAAQVYKRTTSWYLERKMTPDVCSSLQSALDNNFHRIAFNPDYRILNEVTFKVHSSSDRIIVDIIPLTDRARGLFVDFDLLM